MFRYLSIVRGPVLPVRRCIRKEEGTGCHSEEHDRRIDGLPTSVEQPLSQGAMVGECPEGLQPCVIVTELAQNRDDRACIEQARTLLALSDRGCGVPRL